MKLRAKYAVVIAETLFFSLFFGLCVVGQAVAQVVDVSEAWARATVPGQKATGAFMKITAKDNQRLVGVSSSAASVTEVHEMKMDGDVMKMRAIAALDLPAGRTVELKPGGYHVMLMDLKAPLLKDSTLDLNLVFKDAKGVESRQSVKLAVGAPPAAAKAAEAGHAHHGGMKH